MADQDCKSHNLQNVFLAHTHTHIDMNDCTKIGNIAIILNLSNHNLSKKLVLPVTKIAEAINYKWLLRKQIQAEESYK